ncbi:MAG: nitrite/sulfite reductase [Porticoccaceae bacterium]|jgi:sulfite reductase (NADPH) hemoprotein beta-component|nr:nitrite/sulfite reductase [Alphaproteobacteria bacterium]MDP4744770.1 nitrite/sulfite reductase [Porticoccaceae bacterium]MDP4751722.1 nitrite/sulfite reductase [Porticoccaceae bacterium]MDP4890239.1 nitrite/sulfite reductase [Porticoccaceae bacterium]MDP4986974.1 nitrite/sulfite reductase [Porticoccaceae bacterium]
MYTYDQYDQTLVDERVAQFRDQTQRYLDGQISDEEFLPLRLQNGLYVQRLAPMLRIAIPYGLLSSRQVRKLAEISRRFDKGYVHFTTRQNIQLNWPQLEEVPDILAELASVQMHAIQTSGNCIRNTTTDQFAGVAADEIEDPRPWCEIIRQWSTFHPEFAFLPRKFKIAVCGSEEDRAAFLLHDIGIQLVKNDRGETGFHIYVGGGLGRTPVIASSIREFLPQKHLLTYLDAILRVYNRYGNRDNKYKARIKILVKAWTPEVFAQRVESEWQQIIAGDKDGLGELTGREIERVKTCFTLPNYKIVDQAEADAQLAALAQDNIPFARWLSRNVRDQKQPGYSAVTLSLKPAGVAPGDVTDRQLEKIADLADQFSFGELRSTHNQNIVLADVLKSDLFDLWQLAKADGLATPNIGTINDIICCPGGDYCSLANAKSIPVAEAIQRKFEDLDYVYDLGDLELNISGCMNACGHHHVGHIGILGVDKKGEEWYQIQIGGSASKQAALAKVLGPSLSRDAVVEGIEKLLDVYIEHRQPEETFLATYQRIGMDKFKERVYAEHS